jgi:predicted AAA+ superfamily ATPase
VCIDEVQRVPAVLNEVHRALEDFKQQVQFILTGSSARKLKRSGANLLAGRAATYKLHPFTSEEIEIDLNTTLQFGSLPLVYSLKNPIPTLRSYIDTYLTQEIQQEAIVRQLEPFIRFIELAAQFNGQPINYSKIAKQVGVSTNTVIDYFSILVDTLIATRIEPWSYSVIRQLAASPRFYLFDCGVLNALSGELRTELRPSSGRYGNLFETFVVNEIIRANDYYELDNKFFYIRTHSGVEADLIISRGPRDTPRMIEIKSKNSPDEADLKQLFIAHALLPESKAYCICTTPRAYMLRDVTVLPWQTGIHTILENVHF